MAVYFDKERKQWRYNFIIAHKRYSNYCIDPKTGAGAETKSQAKEIETKVKAAVLEARPILPILPFTITFAQAMAAYIAQVKGGRSWGNQRIYVRELLAHFGETTPIMAITETLIWDYIAWARTQKIKIWTGGGVKPGDPLPLGKTEESCWRESERTRSDSTINRYLDALRKALGIMAKQRDPNNGQPLLMAPPHVPKLQEPDALPRPISPTDIGRILEEAPPHLADTIRLCILMGFRQREALSLTINHVDLDNRGVWLRGDETKGKRGEFIPANKEAVEILQRLMEQAKERGIQHLISYKAGKNGKWRPIKHLDTAWHRVLRACGLEGQHKFHNTKATFVTAVAMAAPAPVAQQLARHKDFETTRRYIRIADEVTRKAVESINFNLKPAEKVKSRTQESHTEIKLLLPTMDKPLNLMVGTTRFELATPSPPD